MNAPDNVVVDRSEVRERKIAHPADSKPRGRLRL